MRLLCLVPYPTEGPSNRYRVEQFFPYLRRRSIETDLRPFMTKEFFHLLYQEGKWGKKGRYFLECTLKRMVDLFRARDYDGFLIHIEAYPLGPPLLEWLLSKCGKPIIFDFEDAIYMPDPKSRTIIKALKCRQKFYKILTLSQHVLVCNPYVKDLVEGYNRHVTVLPTSIDIEKFTLRPKFNGGVPVIGWIGSRSTLPYLLHLKEVFEELSKRYVFVLRIIGGGSEVHFPGVHVENRVWRLETEVEDFQSLDIGIYPLPETEWARAKTPFKSIQYMSVGIPVVVSPVGGNCTIVQEGCQGYFADSKEEWIEKLSHLLKSSTVRETLGHEGRRRVEADYSLQKNQSIFCDVVEQTLLRKRSSHRRKLFHLITDLDIGGTPILLNNILTHTDREKYDVIVCSLKRRNNLSVFEDIQKLDIPIFFLKAEKFLLFQTLYRLYLLLKDEEVDILHTWLFHANLFGRLAGWWARIPFILSSELAIDREKGVLRILLDRLTMELSKRLIVNAEAIREIVREREKVPDSKIKLIKTGVDTQKFSVDGSVISPQKCLGKEGKEQVLLVVARLHAAKGHKTLLEALPQILTLFPRVKVLFAGDGPLRTSLEAWTRAHRLENVVTFLGIQRDIPSLLKESSLFILPSHEEGMPAAILEAMACGKPVIASKVGGISEIVLDGETGLLVPSGEAESLKEAVTFLLDHPEKAAAFGLKGRERVEALFDIRDRVRELERLYEEVCGEVGVGKNFPC